MEKIKLTCWIHRANMFCGKTCRHSRVGLGTKFGPGIFHLDQPHCFTFPWFHLIVSHLTSDIGGPIYLKWWKEVTTVGTTACTCLIQVLGPCNTPILSAAPTTRGPRSNLFVLFYFLILFSYSGGGLVDHWVERPSCFTILVRRLCQDEMNLFNAKKKINFFVFLYQFQPIISSTFSCAELKLRFIS